MSELLRKLVQLVVVFVVVTFFVVVLMSLVPGKPENVVIPFDSSPNKELTQQFRKENNLDRALPVRWAKWAGKFVQGDMGDLYSSTETQPVSKGIKDGAPISALMILYTQIVSLVIAVPLAVWAAYKAGGVIDRVLSATMFGFISLPSFAVVLALSYLLGVKLGVVLPIIGRIPARGYVGPTEDIGRHIASMIIPITALSLGQIAIYMRLLRSDLVATLQEDFILMAKAKGISNRRVLWRHALRPSSLTLLTVAGLSIGNLIGGTLVVEFLLGIPGLGFQVGSAILGRQYVQLQSLVAIIAIVFVLVNFIVDALYNVLDPRIREQSS